MTARSRRSGTLFALSKFRRQTAARSELNSRASTIPPLPDFEALTHLRVTDLSVGDAERHATGKLGDYLSRRTPGRAYDVPPLIRTLISQITRRSDYAGAVTSAADVLDRKAIARADLERWLELAGVAADPARAVGAIEQMLSGPIPFTRIKRLRKEIMRYQVERLDIGNRDIRYLRRAVLQAMSLLGEVQVLADVIRSVDEDAALRAKFDDVFGHEYVVAAALLEAYEDHELPPAGEEPEEEAE